MILNKIAAVVAVFHPDHISFNETLRAISKQVERVILVNNGGLNVSLVENSFDFVVLGDGTNLGIGAAQNLGISWAKSNGIEYLLTLDQDSIPSPDMVDKLHSAASHLQSQGVQVAACGPRFLLRQNDNPSVFLRVGGFGLVPATEGGLFPYLPCDFLISSGMLIPLDTLNQVGLMDESLFIDHVDTEWCFRAASHGYKCFGVADAMMRHKLGSGCRTIRFGNRVRNLPQHFESRYYFIVRNGMILRRRAYMPKAWQRHDFIRVVGLLMASLLTTRQGFGIARKSFRGFIDGLQGVSGPGPCELR